MCQADSATALVAAVVEAAGVPVTVKMRLRAGRDDETCRPRPGLWRGRSRRWARRR